jgi:hypothetical protein
MLGPKFINGLANPNCEYAIPDRFDPMVAGTEPVGPDMLSDPGPIKTSLHRSPVVPRLYVLLCVGIMFPEMSISLFPIETILE